MINYLIEIKNRTVLVLLTWISVSIIAYLYKESLLFLITQPYYTVLSKHDSTVVPYFIFTNITELFSVYIKITLFCSSQMGILALVYHSLLFLSPAFFNLERFYLEKLIKTLLLVWVISIFFANSFLIPITWNFFLSFQQISAFKSVSLHFEAKLSEYIAFYITLYRLCIFYCQLVTIMIFFLQYYNTTIYSIRKFRKVYYYIFVVITTMLTPPDVSSQIVISSVIIVVYEICLFLWIIQRQF